MLSSHFRYGFICRSVAVSFLFLVVSGCTKEVSPQTKRTVTFDCGSRMSEGRGHNVRKKEYPFTGAPQTFTNNPSNPDAPVTSPPAKYTGSLVVYHYEISINGTRVEDPQVVGGGGHSLTP